MGNGEMPCFASPIRDIRVIRGFFVVEPDFVAKVSKNPTDRGKLGVKRSVLTDGCGVPLGVEVSGANTHDFKLLKATLDSTPIKRPKPAQRKKQHLCLDKGYDSDDARCYLRRRRYTPHIKPRGEEAHNLKTKPGYRARRWVVERTHS